MLDAQKGPLTTNTKHVSNSMTATCSLKVTLSEQMMMMLIVTSTRRMTMTHQNNSIVTSRLHNLFSDPSLYEVFVGDGSSQPDSQV